MQHTLVLPDYTPTLLNQLMGSVGARIRLKKSDRELVSFYARQAGIPVAVGRRRVSLVVSGWERGGRLPDPDSPIKTTLDALVQCKLLVDDSRAWCELGSVRVERGPRQTTVFLEDLDAA